MRSCICEPQQRVGGCEICREPTFGVPLAPREREVVVLYSQGCRTKEIAARLGRSPKTIHTHLENAQRKLGLKDRVALRGWRDLEAARQVLNQAPMTWYEHTGPNGYPAAWTHRREDGIFLSGTFRPEELEALALLARNKQ